MDLRRHCGRFSPRCPCGDDRPAVRRAFFVSGRHHRMPQRRRSGLARCKAWLRDLRGVVSELNGLTADLTRLVGSMMKLLGLLFGPAGLVVACRALF